MSYTAAMSNTPTFIDLVNTPTVVQRIKRWWLHLPSHRQDRFAMLAPVLAVLLFLAAIVSALSYLRLEEMDREQEAVRRDVEYTQQRLRLRLLERQEMLMRLARDVSNRELDVNDFTQRAEEMVSLYPELERISWVNERRKVRTSVETANQPASQSRSSGDAIKSPDTLATMALTEDLRQPVYAQQPASLDTAALLQLHIPLTDKGRFSGVVLAEYSVDGLYRYGVPNEVAARYAVSMHDADGTRLAGSVLPNRGPAHRQLPWASNANAYEVPVSPVGNGLVIRAQPYRTSLGFVGSGLFWLVSALSAMTAWMLIGNWRHMRRRMKAQQELISETNFRRAIHNSTLSAMRPMTSNGRITYVNAAFCQMTGWSERELVGRTAPFPYWPDADRETLTAALQDEISGKTTVGGIQVRVKRKDGAMFEARLYVSPLIDAVGKHTGWMTSMTDITEPNRIREQLSASYERFTTVLEALDASISVAPLGNEEVLFANKLYRQWFGTEPAGHLQLMAQSGLYQRKPSDEIGDTVDSYAGMPMGALQEVETESAEIYLTQLGKWLEVRTRYLSWVDGRLAQMVIATDITARRLAEEREAEQAERAQNASRLITMGEMASSVAHELNQPLTAINNYCNGMVSRIKARQIKEDDLLSALEKTARQAHRAGQIIQRIRSFVKRSEPNRTRSDIQEIVNEAVELADIEMRRRNVRLVHHVAEGLPPLMVDPILIEQVLVNLLKNGAESVDAAERPSNSREVELVVAPRLEDGQAVVAFCVQDTGKGITPEVMERLYEAFFSTKVNGMGIGLSLCRSIIESHQGRMTAENIYNAGLVEGCRFTFWLPQDNEPAIAGQQGTQRLIPG